MTQFNPYRTFANDGKALSQWKPLPKVECSECHEKFNTTMELIVDGKCEKCAAKAAK